MLFSIGLNAQVTLDIGSTETLHLSSNSQLTVDGITYTPSANKTLSNVTFSKATSTANTTSINNIQKVISIANSWTNFSGSIRFTYLTSELNGLNENDLKVSTYNGSSWIPLTATTVTAATNVATVNLTTTNISELTLQISGTTTSTTTTTTTVTPTSSSGGGGGGSSTPAVDPNDTDGDGVANALDAFPNDPNEWEDSDADGIGNNGDPDDDNDGVYDVVEREYITIYTTLNIIVSPNGSQKVVSNFKDLPEDKGVGKWKIRKKLTGGADKALFYIANGEPATYSAETEQKNTLTGELRFITPPNYNNPQDQNKDNIYEVEVALINTTANDNRVPVPTFNLNVTVAENTTAAVALTTTHVDLAVYGPENVSSDTDADLSNNPFDKDDDGDGIFSDQEGNDPNSDGDDIDALDTDGDGFVDYLDPDDDNDTVFTQYEYADPNGDLNPNDALDSDGDGIPNYLDTDDDGDGILTKDESSDLNQDGNPQDALDTDGDGIPNYFDTDDDNDGILTLDELTASGSTLDTDSDGIPNHLDADDDGDGLATLYELAIDGTFVDTDSDTIPNHLDSDDDNDGILTTNEDANGNGDPRDDDTDQDGTPDYLESNIEDSDSDGVVDQRDTVDDDPYNDQDGDGFPDLDEKLAGTDPLDPNSYPKDFNNPNLRASISIVTFFSPNGDGTNDTWQVKEIDRYPNSHVWIYTRSGKLVFESQPYRNNWAGQYEGTNLPEGSYYYRIDLDGNGSVDFEGWLYLTR